MRFEKHHIALSGLALLAASPGFAATPTRYEGVCEVSAAAVLDERHFVVASDETETLTIYERDTATPIARHALAGVTDIEAAARIGDTIYWLTSHSLNKDGEDKAKRKQIRATRILSPTRLVDVPTPAGDLRATLADVLGRASDAKFPDELDIEGLASTPSGRLFIGLRSPLDSNESAQIIEIADPLAASGAPAVASKPLPLGRRGIRSIERIGSGESKYMIVAGPVVDSGGEAALFSWDGAGTPVALSMSLFEGPVPEALIAWGDGSLQLLGDNGDACSDELEGPRWFPSMTIGNVL
ncbi:MAG: DUF3616 domain-containing protein [Sphingopyxis sp.]|nr:DUF3616 domain-containing protein [Sphingopyxis sp.]